MLLDNIKELEGELKLIEKWAKRENLEDGTYSFHQNGQGGVAFKKVSFDKGYQVSFVNPKNRNNQKAFWSGFKLMKNVTKNGTAYLGVYQGETELSFHFDDLSLAHHTACVFEQISIWDWENMREILLD